MVGNKPHFSKGNVMTENEKLKQVAEDVCEMAETFDVREIEVEKTTAHMKIKVRVKR
jgi:hypothetical protein